MSGNRSRMQAFLTWRCPTVYAVLLCLASFLAGRIRLGVNTVDVKGSAGTIAAGPQYVKPVDPFTAHMNRMKRVLAGNATFEEALKASGLERMKPPVKPAASGDAEYTLAPFQIISWYPRAVLFPKFLDNATCESFKKIANKRLAPSTVALRQGEDEETQKNVRTSSGTFVSSAEDHTGMLRAIEERIARVTMLPASHGEEFNVLRYNLGQKYDSHYDFFNPKEYGEQKTQRAATVLLYLSTPEEGGETIFKLEGASATRTNDYTSCTGGLKYKPRAGDALLFWSLNLKKEFDVHALHGGCPVVKGEKWAATKWVHDRPFH